MTRADAPLPVSAQESLTRFILQQSWIRSSDQTVKPDAFIPHPYKELSVYRRSHLLDAQVWEIGKGVSQARKKSLYGRADIICRDVRAHELEAAPDEPPPNHCIITGWPNDKPAQKKQAMLLAAKARLILAP